MSFHERRSLSSVALFVVCFCIPSEGSAEPLYRLDNNNLSVTAYTLGGWNSDSDLATAGTSSQYNIVGPPSGQGIVESDASIDGAGGLNWIAGEANVSISRSGFVDDDHCVGTASSGSHSFRIGAVNAPPGTVDVSGHVQFVGAASSGAMVTMYYNGPGADLVATFNSSTWHVSGYVVRDGMSEPVEDDFPGDLDMEYTYSYTAAVGSNLGVSYSSSADFFWPIGPGTVDANVSWACEVD